MVGTVASHNSNQEPKKSLWLEFDRASRTSATRPPPDSGQRARNTHVRKETPSVSTEETLPHSGVRPRAWGRAGVALCAIRVGEGELAAGLHVNDLSFLKGPKGRGVQHPSLPMLAGEGRLGEVIFYSFPWRFGQPFIHICTIIGQQNQKKKTNYNHQNGRKTLSSNRLRNS